MTTPTPPDRPVEERLADRISARQPATATSWLVRLLRRSGRLDRAAYSAVARLYTPRLDRPLRQVSEFANFSKPWLITAGVLAVVGGPRGRRAAAAGLASIGITSFVVNQPMKLAGDRGRPNRTRLGVPEDRWVRMPTSTSFPSGHSASAAAFAVSVGNLVPGLRSPLRASATVVAFSRVYTGVHYPGDVVAGATVGALVGWGTSSLMRRLRRRSSRPVLSPPR
jgi:membrane-associated phospholipid phosphatase